MIRLRRERYSATLGLDVGRVTLELYVERGATHGWSDGRDDPEERVVFGRSSGLPTFIASIAYPYSWHDRITATRDALRRTLRP